MLQCKKNNVYISIFYCIIIFCLEFAETSIFAFYQAASWGFNSDMIFKGVAAHNSI